MPIFLRLLITKGGTVSIVVVFEAIEWVFLTYFALASARSKALNPVVDLRQTFAHHVALP